MYSGALRDTRATLVTSEAYFIFTSDSDQMFDDEGFSIYYEFTQIPPGQWFYIQTKYLLFP